MNGAVLRGEVHQNLYVPAGTAEVQALITVDATGEEPSGPAPTAPEAAEVVIIDDSGSMGAPEAKIRAAVEATIAAVDEMRDGVLFAVVAGSTRARVVYPGTGAMVRAEARTRADARAAVKQIRAGGGTAIGTWLELARGLLAAHPDAIRHAILLTDGHNTTESLDQLTATVAACEGVFRCDCRGIGADWSVTELRTIARGLLGSFDKIAEPAAMAEDFRTMMAASMRKEVAEIALQVWAPVGARVTLVKQAAPDPVDLTPRGEQLTERISRYPTGAWGTEQRDFHITVAVPPAAVNQERLACRAEFVQVLPDGSHSRMDQTHVRTRPNGSREALPEAMVSAIWTDDPARNTDLHPRVVITHDREAVEEAVDKATDAFGRGETGWAADWLKSARATAERAGMDDLVNRIDDMLDPVTGTYRIDADALLDLGVESSKQEPWRDPAQSDDGTP